MGRASRRQVAASHPHVVLSRTRTAVASGYLVIGAAGLVAAVVMRTPAAAIAIGVWTLVLLLQVYRCGRVADLTDLRASALLSAQVTLGVLVAVLVFGDLDSTRRTAALIASATVLAACVRWALAQKRVRAWLRLDQPEVVLLVGRSDGVSRTIAEWADDPRVRVAAVCLADGPPLPDCVAGTPVVGGVADVVGEARRLRVDIVALHDVANLGGWTLAALQWGLEDAGIQMSLITPMTNTGADRARIRRVGHRVIVDLGYSRPRGVAAVAKGVVERLVALAGLIVALPVVAACAVLVKATSSGPAFFRQTRVREGGRTFTMYKIRTMTVDAEARQVDLADLNIVGGDGMFKMVVDPRVTRVGGWMRRLSLDEVPQLWNVVRGDMSLIGPRPGTPDEVATYDEFASRRLIMKPGLTGLWQVSGRSNLTWEETVRLDQVYIDNWLPRRDLAIALRTVKAVVTKEGAY